MPQDKDNRARAATGKDGGTRIKESHIFGIILLISFFLFFQLASQPDRLRRTLSAFNLYPKPDRFTELYFPDSTRLPRAGESLAFAFTVRNREGRPMSYPYAVYLASGSRKLLLGSGALTLQADESRVVAGTYVLGTFDPGASIRVELPDQRQEIHFLLAS